MRAVLIATGDGPGVAPLDERYPVPLLPLVDRPFLQHVIEFVAGQGVTRFDLVLSHLPEKIEFLLGDGTRWGSRFTFHLARDPLRPYRLLKALNFGGEGREPILLGHADRLPSIQLHQARLAHCGTAPVLFCWRDGAVTNPAGQRRWTGWALLSPEQMATLPADAGEDGLKNHLLAVPGAEDSLMEVPPPLSVQTFGGILASHKTVLDKEFPGLFLGGRETDPGVWLSRNVVLHPTVRILPPVYVAEGCQIGAGVQLGPHASIGKGCVLDTHCTVANSVIFPGSYVGEALELADVIVDKNCLVNARFGGTVTVADDFILSALAGRHLVRGMTGLLGRVIALLGLVLAAPVLLVTAFFLKIIRRGKVLHRKEVVRLPVPPEEWSWGTFDLWSFSPDGDQGRNRQHPGSLRNLFLRFLPALVNIAKGDLSFVGVSPRTRDEIKGLPHDWQSLYLRTKAGIVTEASVRYGANPTDDELYAAEAFYAVTAGWAHDLRLLLRYFGRAFFGTLLPKRDAGS